MEPTIHYHVHNSQPLVPILSQINPIHVLFNVRFNVTIHLV